MKYDVITIGSATIDVFVESGKFDVHKAKHVITGAEGCFPLGTKIEIDGLIQDTGGGGSNAAFTFANLGFKTAVVTSIGDDGNGKLIRDMLEKKGISTEFVRTDKKNPTAYSVIMLTDSGERTILVYRGAAKKIGGSRVPWDKMQPKWFYISSLGGDMELLRKAFNYAERKGVKVAWNPGSTEIAKGLKVLGPLIEKTEVLLLNREEASKLTRKPPKNLKSVAAILREYPKRAAIITDGRDGAYAFERDSALYCPSLTKERVNTTGAGDAFGSGLIAGLMRRNDLKYALGVASYNATGVIGEMGAKKGLITKFPTDAAIKKIKILPWK